MQIACYTGARVHSLGLLRWEDIYQQNGIDIMLIKDRKNARRKGKAVGEVLGREVVIEAELLDILHHQPGEKKGLGFEKRFIDTLSTNIGDLSEALGEPRITMSNFRSYRATQLHLRGVPPKVYEQQMGHSTRVAERYYIQVSVEDAARYVKG